MARRGLTTKEERDARRANAEEMARKQGQLDTQGGYINDLGQTDAALSARIDGVQDSLTTNVNNLTNIVNGLRTDLDAQTQVNSAQATRINNLESDMANHNHDGRYYGKGNTDSWFLRHNSHPLGTVQLHGNGYHSPQFVPQ